MRARVGRRLVGVLVALTLVAAAADASAKLALFGNYWENVARAAAENDPSAVNQLLTGGTSPDQTDDNGRTGLQIAAIGGNLQIAAILIKAGAHLNNKDTLGNTALHYAAERNHLDMAQLLLDAGAAVDPENRDGMTPLMIAASRGYIEIVQALLAKGANVRKADFTGRDAMSWAQDSHRPAAIRAIERAAAQR